MKRHMSISKLTHKTTNKLAGSVKKLAKSIWLLPVIATVVLIALTTFKVHGSSLGIYDYYFGKDIGRALIINSPQTIRSDEWLVVTQMTAAQAHNNYQLENGNIGHGQDMSTVSGVPTKEWTTLFRFENWAFFILPFEHAFAFKWWVFSYLLVLSVYFFVLLVLRKRRLIATLLALTLLFSPFVQWWYQFITLAPIYLGFFIAINVVYLFRQNSRLQQYLLALSLAYLLTSYALIIYPPFQIAVMLAIGAFIVGHLINIRSEVPKSVFIRKLVLVGGAAVIASSFALLFVTTRSDVVHAITNTAYPGKRNIESGGASPVRLFSGFLNMQLEDLQRATHFGLNQSENSNFILLAPFLVVPCIVLFAYQHKKKRSIDWALVLINVLLIFLLVRLFIPFFDPLFELVLLNKVPHPRLVIAFGALTIIQLVLFVKAFANYQGRYVQRKYIIIYSLLCLTVNLVLSQYISHTFPGYIGTPKAIILSIVVTSIIYLLLRKKTLPALCILFALSFLSTNNVNPLYSGMNPLLNNEVSQSIRHIGIGSDKHWATDSIHLMNFPSMNGEPSLTGTYYYPQFDIWNAIARQEDKDTINRYAHVLLDFDRDPTTSVPIDVKKVQDDLFTIKIEPCDKFLKDSNVGYIIVEEPLPDPCVVLVDTVVYPNRTIYIYRTLEP